MQRELCMNTGGEMGRLTNLDEKLKLTGALSPAEQRKLVDIAKYYRKMAAMQIAERAFLEMKDYGQIGEEIRPLGYRLVKIINSRIPVLEELSTTMSSPADIPLRVTLPDPEEKVAGAYHAGSGW